MYSSLSLWKRKWDKNKKEGGWQQRDFAGGTDLLLCVATRCRGIAACHLQSGGWQQRDFAGGTDTFSFRGDVLQRHFRLSCTIAKARLPSSCGFSPSTASPAALWHSIAAVTSATAAAAAASAAASVTAALPPMLPALCGVAAGKAVGEKQQVELRLPLLRLLFLLLERTQGARSPFTCWSTNCSWKHRECVAAAI